MSSIPIWWQSPRIALTEAPTDVTAHHISRIEFRRGTTTPAWGAVGTETTVDVLIDGVGLKALWQEATGEGCQSLLAQGVPTELGMWGPYDKEIPDSYHRNVPAGFVPVLTCSCTDFGCGGVSARVTFTPVTVIWRNFRLVRKSEAAPLGPFMFDRQQYEVARRGFADAGI